MAEIDALPSDMVTSHIPVLYSVFLIKPFKRNVETISITNLTSRSDNAALCIVVQLLKIKDLGLHVYFKRCFLQVLNSDAAPIEHVSKCNAQGAMCDIFDPEQFVKQEQQPIPYSLIILNQIIDAPEFQLLFNRAVLRACADGGYDRWRNWCEENHVTLEEPDYIIGDMDSISEHCLLTKKPYRIVIEDQNKNDLQKSLEYMSSKGHINFLVIGALGGRFDHELQSLSCLYQYTRLKVIYVNANCAVTLLRKGKTVIISGAGDSHCGFGPLRDRAQVQTSGFQWDLDGQCKNADIYYMSSAIFRSRAWFLCKHIKPFYGRSGYNIHGCANYLLV